jgi:protein-disulfide isomerase
MKPSTAGKVCAAVIVAIALAWTSVRAIAGPQDRDDLRQRVVALEASQKAMLKELQDIKALLQSRPAPAAPAAAQAAAPAAQAAPAPPPPMNIDVAIDGAAVRGRADAKVVVVEFSDFQCPFCGRFARETMGLLERDYVDTGKVRWVFRHFPIERLHPFALRASEAAECGRAQDKFWPMHTRLFANQQALGEADLVKTAQAAGLNMPAFQQCFASQLISPTRIRQDLADGTKAGITGTPAFFIGIPTKDGKVHALRKLIGAQAYPSFKTAIDNILSSPQVASR